jgi:hypothetical protein
MLTGECVAGGDGQSYVGLLRWFWGFVGLPEAVPISGHALADGRYYLQAVRIIAPQASRAIASSEAARVDKAADNFELLTRLLSACDIKVNGDLVEDLRVEQFQAVHDFLRKLHSAATRTLHCASPLAFARDLAGSLAPEGSRAQDVRLARYTW